jgi:hypothetical protein
MLCVCFYLGTPYKRIPDIVPDKVLRSNRKYYSCERKRATVTATTGKLIPAVECILCHIRNMSKTNAISYCETITLHS